MYFGANANGKFKDCIFDVIHERTYDGMRMNGLKTKTPVGSIVQSVADVLVRHNHRFNPKLNINVKNLQF